MLSRTIRWTALGASLLLAFSAFADDALDNARAQIGKKFRQITPAIYAGPNPMNAVPALEKLKIATVISLQGGDIDRSVAGAVCYIRQKGDHPAAIQDARHCFENRNIEFHNFPLTSHKPKTSTEDFSIRAALEVMARATPDAPVYIHCHHGADRTGLLVALYRVKYQGWSPEDAHVEWVNNGHHRVSRWFTGHLDIYFFNYVGMLPGQEKSSAACAEDLEVKVISRRDGADR